MIIICHYAILINTNYDRVDDDENDKNDKNDNNIDNDNDSSSCHHIDNRRNYLQIIMFILSTI